MADHIPFIGSGDSLKLAVRFYGDSNFLRVPLNRIAAVATSLPNTIKLWLDPCVDGLHDLEARRPRDERPNPWFEFMQQFAGFNAMGGKAFWTKPDPNEVDKFVTSLLDFCVRYKPAWLTVPQLPVADDSSRNKINLALARATGRWKSKRNFPGRLILPLVFTPPKTTKRQD